MINVIQIDFNRETIETINHDTEKINIDYKTSGNAMFFLLNSYNQSLIQI